jgi:acylphosphatase
MGDAGRAPGAKGGPRAAVHVFFSGIVQGVFFRAHTRREAVRLGLVGWVRNLEDGRVEAWAEGDRAAVEQLLEYCSADIPTARVEHVDFDWMAPTGELRSFEVVD